MASCAIFLDFPETLKSRNHEIKTTVHDSFGDCRMHFLLTTFLEIAIFITAQPSVTHVSFNLCFWLLLQVPYTLYN